MRQVCLILTMAAAVVVGVSTSAQASPLSCPGIPSGRVFTLTTSTDSICYAYQAGTLDHNLSGNNDPINQLDGGIWTTIDKSDDLTSGVDPFKTTLSITGLGTTSGSFGFSDEVWSAFARVILAFKTGGGPLDPNWVAFDLPSGVTSGDWSISGRQGLGHVNLYGIEGDSGLNGDPASVPEPMSLVLLGLGLAFGAFRLRRRK